jgi:hypothetical protein
MRSRNRATGERVFPQAGGFTRAKDAPMTAHAPHASHAQAQRTQGPLAMFRPVLWLAAAAFAAGFGGYIMLSPAVHGG